MDQRIVGIASHPDAVTITTKTGEFERTSSSTVPGCTAIGWLDWLGWPEVRIIPFRGEYYELSRSVAPGQRPDLSGADRRSPSGVHLTRINGSVGHGPNAIFALAREGYTKLTINPRDVVDSVRWPGLWRLGKRFWRTGLDEARRSLSKKRFLASLRELVQNFPTTPYLDACRRTRPGAAPRRRLVDDFYYERAPRQVHVLNAPSPAATASLEIGKRIADELEAS